MSNTINPVYTTGFKAGGTYHRFTIWQASNAGDMAALTLDDNWLIEVSGDAVQRLQVVADAVVAAMGGDRQ